MKKVLSLVLVLVFLMSAFSVSAATFKAGTYTAQAPGMAGDVKIEMTLSDDRIESVKVTEHKETPGISDPAIEQIPAGIVAGQGLKVDAITGATLTSNAILAAAEDCLKQAGADVEALKAKGPEAQILEDETITTDVVIVGAGMAGLSAAAAAADAGAKVVVLEKMGAVGGASITCGGELLAAGTTLQKEQGIEDNATALGDYWVAAGEGKVDESLLRMIADKSAETYEWLKSQGVAFGGLTYSYNYPSQSPLRNHESSDGSGIGFIKPLEATIQQKGVELLLETKALSLIKEGNQVTGVVAENKGRKVTVMAKAVILATGGFANNEELMKEYCPKIGAFGTFLGEVHQGDGLIMAAEAGALISAPGGAIANPMDLGPTQYGDPNGIFLNVDAQGNRFANENEYWFTRSAKVYFETAANYYYSIFDSKNQHPKLEEAVKAGTVLKADTIDELAALMGVDKAVLTATIERYNTMCKDQKDSDFNKPVSGPLGVRVKYLQNDVPFLTAVDAAPFYALKCATVMVTGTFGGPRTTAKGEVVATDNSLIPGLYAAGEVANGDLFYHRYPCSGTSIQFCATMGRLSGEAAAEFAKK